MSGVQAEAYESWTRMKPFSICGKFSSGLSKQPANFSFAWKLEPNLMKIQSRLQKHVKQTSVCTQQREFNAILNDRVSLKAFPFGLLYFLNEWPQRRCIIPFAKWSFSILAFLFPSTLPKTALLGAPHHDQNYCLPTAHLETLSNPLLFQRTACRLFLPEARKVLVWKRTAGWSEDFKGRQRQHMYEFPCGTPSSTLFLGAAWRKNGGSS